MVLNLHINPNYPNLFAFLRMFGCPEGQKKSECPTVLYFKVMTATEMKHQGGYAHLDKDPQNLKYIRKNRFFLPRAGRWWSKRC